MIFALGDEVIYHRYEKHSRWDDRREEYVRSQNHYPVKAIVIGVSKTRVKIEIGHGAKKQICSVPPEKLELTLRAVYKAQNTTMVGE